MLATGSDTGNSLRNPAQNVGVGSIKPSYGLVPKHGVTVSNTTLDTCGSMGRSMADVARFLGITAGPDPRDARSEQAPTFPNGFPLTPRPGRKPFAGMRIGSTIETETSPDGAVMTTGDPTNARLRGFDIPVVMPRFDLVEVPDFEEAVFTGDLRVIGRVSASKLLCIPPS